MFIYKLYLLSILNDYWNILFFKSVINDVMVCVRFKLIKIYCLFFYFLIIILGKSKIFKEIKCN